MKNEKLKKEGGFTLIELLVVVAILGIFAAIALASVNSARTKSADAAVKTSLGNIAAQAELYYDNNGSTYSDNPSGEVTTCDKGVFSDPIVKKQIDDAKAQAATGASAKCFTGIMGTSNGQLWAVSIDRLKSGTGAWCVDNSGGSGAGKQADTSGKCK